VRNAMQGIARPTVLFAAVAVALTAMLLVGALSIIELFGGFVMAAIVLLVHRRATGVSVGRRAMLLDVVAVLVVGIHVVLGVVYAFVGLVPTRIGEADRTALSAVVMAGWLGWLAVLVLTVGLWSRRHWLLFATPLLSIAVLLLVQRYSDALPRVPEPHSPTTVGLIVSREDREEGRSTLRLASGDTVEVFLTLRRRPSVAPTMGTLLIFGQEGWGRPWFYALQGTPDCFHLVEPGAPTDHGNWIRFSFGLELPKAIDYAPPRDDTSESSPADFCVNAEGEVKGRLGP
jgi:hypothetical protein